MGYLDPIAKINVRNVESFNPSICLIVAVDFNCTTFPKIISIAMKVGWESHDNFFVIIDRVMNSFVKIRLGFKTRLIWLFSQLFRHNHPVFKLVELNLWSLIEGVWELVQIFRLIRNPDG